MKRSLRTIAWVLGAVAVVVIIVMTASFLYEQAVKRLKQEESSITPRTVLFSMSINDYNDECTKIPVDITGTDTKGNAIETTIFTDALNVKTELVPGEYEISFPASPLTPDGILYKPPPKTTVKVSLNSKYDTVIRPFNSSSLTFTKTTALEETDEMIDAAYNYAIKDEAQVEKADKLWQIALSAHQQAVDIENVRKRLANEREEREAARQEYGLGQIINMPLYTLQLPKYWRGKVNIKKDGNDLIITPKGFSDATILSVKVTPPGVDGRGGDYATGIIQSDTTSDGYNVYLWLHRWVTDAMGGNDLGYSDQLLQTCIQLQSGGTTTLEEARLTPHNSPGGILGASLNFIEDNVVLKLKNDN